MEKIVCFYHVGDLDGQCSGEIVRRHYECISTEPVKMIGINYGYDYEKYVFGNIDKETTVIMVDFSLQPFHLMARLSKACKNFVWIDHHSKVIKTYNKNVELGTIGEWSGRRVIGTAACELVWEYFRIDEPMPNFVRLLGLYDVWKWQGHPGVLEFQMGMKAENTEVGADIWNELFLPDCYSNRTISKLINQGHAVIKYREVENKIHIESAGFEIKWKNMNWLVINEMFNNSQLFDSRYDPEKHHGMMKFGYRRGRWIVDVYTTRDDVNVGDIAKKMGGGGHDKAAGFNCRKLPFRLPGKSWFKVMIEKVRSIFL